MGRKYHIHKHTYFDYVVGVNYNVVCILTNKLITVKVSEISSVYLIY